MEEVEALCTRVGVMVSGRMQCLGSSQHLKSKFGGEYQVELRCHPSRVEECLELCMSFLPSPVLDEKHGGYFRLKVGRDVDLARAFSSLEEFKEKLSIYDYNISQCTLEQVFIQFAKEQEEEVALVTPQAQSPTQAHACADLKPRPLDSDVDSNTGFNALEIESMRKPDDHSLMMDESSRLGESFHTGSPRASPSIWGFEGSARVDRQSPR